MIRVGDLTEDNPRDRLYSKTAPPRRPRPSPPKRGRWARSPQSLKHGNGERDPQNDVHKGERFPHDKGRSSVGISHERSVGARRCRWHEPE